MYGYCIFCKSALSANQSIEKFPVGRRLAFDAARGRLWVVCKHCTRWNLSPLEERWEAIEECERLYRATHTRFATENIGLARVRDGLQLIRIGAPQRPEFAAWRYGSEFRRRFRRTVIATTSVAAAAGGLVVGGPTLGLISGAGLSFMAHLSTWYQLYQQNVRTVLRLPTPSGDEIRFKQKHIGQTRLVTDSGSWALELQHADGHLKLTGFDAVIAAGILLANINSRGARSKTIQEAVRELEHAPDADYYFGWVSRRLTELQRRSTDRRMFWPDFPRTADHRRLEFAPTEVRLALEMIAHEDNERRAMAGELKELEDMWREAEAIAAISDNLLVPTFITDFIQRKKQS